MRGEEAALHMLDLETYVHQSAAPARRVPPSPRRHLDDLSARCEWSSAVDSLDTYPQAAAAAIGGVRAEMACSMITADGKRHVLFDLSKWEIFDLATDGEEKKNVAGDAADADTLKGALTGWMERPK